MNKFISFLFSLILLAHYSFCQKMVISGTIEDKSTGERIIGAAVKNMSLNNGSISNTYGHYAIQTNSSPTTLRFSMLGFETAEYDIVAQKDTTIHVALNPIELDEVVVRGDKQVKKTSISAIHFESPDLLDYPSIKPEVDILNIVQMQSGVQSGLEGSVGFSVRGGNNDQNLILMDNIPLYNTGHLAGFVSIFDPYAIKSMAFYKGGFPAQYAERYLPYWIFI